jgi:Holliday junction resolvasome RuvABC endonuclease subunit
MSLTPLRILAVDPGTKHMGVAVLEGSHLIHYGVRSFRKKRPAHELLRATDDALDALGDLIRAYRPTVLAYEKTFFVQAKSSALLNVQEAEVRRVGGAAALTVIGYSPARVRKLLCRDGWANKRQVAETLAVRFPELAGYLEAQSPHQERYWSNMFDAVAVAVVCADAHASRSGLTGAPPASVAPGRPGH